MEAIDQLLSLQLDQMSKLQSLLIEERTLLTNRDADALVNFIIVKKDLLDKVHQVDQLLKQHPQAEALNTPSYQANVEKLKQQFLLCQKENAINEEIVNQSLSSLDRLGKIMTEVRSTNLTYDSAAKKVSMSGNSLNNLKA